MIGNGGGRAPAIGERFSGWFPSPDGVAKLERPAMVPDMTAAEITITIVIFLFSMSRSLHHYTYSATSRGQQE